MEIEREREYCENCEGGSTLPLQDGLCPRCIEKFKREDKVRMKKNPMWFWIAICFPLYGIKIGMFEEIICIYFFMWLISIFFNESID